MPMTHEEYEVLKSGGCITHDTSLTAAEILQRYEELRRFEESDPEDTLHADREADVGE